MNTPRSEELIRRREHLTFRGNLKQGRHGWLRLTPAYSLYVVEGVLRECRGSHFALDPFSGTGTTPLACACSGVPCHAIDVNPFLVWFGNAKVGKYADATQKSLRIVAQQAIASGADNGDVAQAWVPGLHQIEKWWDRSTLLALARLFRGIAELHENPNVDLLRIAFCRVMIQHAHVTFGHQSMSFKRRPRGLFDSGDAFDVVADGFLEAVDGIAASIASDDPIAEARVFLGDSRDVASFVPRNDYSLVVTSPPYPNRMSYIRELRPYMYWLGYLASGRQAGELDWHAIGGTWGSATSLLNKWEPAPGSHIPYPGFAEMIAEIRREHDTLGRYVHRYFDDIRRHIASLRNALRPGAQCHYVVGNSKFYGTLVPVEQVYAVLFREAGFRKVRVETLRKRNSKKELFEYLVCAEAP